MCALLPYPHAFTNYLFYKSNLFLFLISSYDKKVSWGYERILPPACRRHPAVALSTQADSTCELTNLLQRAVRLEGLALPVAVDADIPQLHLLLNVPNQPFGIGEKLHVRDEEPNTINTINITGTDREIVRDLLLDMRDVRCCTAWRSWSLRERGIIPANVYSGGGITSRSFDQPDRARPEQMIKEKYERI